MNLTLEARYGCLLCGCQLKSWSFPSGARVNKRSIRLHPAFIMGAYGDCPECGTVTVEPLGVRFRLDPESAEKVREYRARRWPDLAGVR